MSADSWIGIALLVVAFAGVRRGSALVGTQAVARPLPSS